MSSDSEAFSSSTENTPRTHLERDDAMTTLGQSAGGIRGSIPENTAQQQHQGNSTGIVYSGSIVPPATTVASPFLTLAPSSEIHFTDFARIAHSFELVSGQTAAGLERLKTVAEFVRRVCTAKANYAQELLKTSAAYASTQITGGGKLQSPSIMPQPSPSKPSSSIKDAKSVPSGGGGNVGESSSVLTIGEDAMSSSGAIWNDLREQLFEEARQEQEFSAKVVEEIVQPMLLFHTEAEKKRRNLVAHHTALSGQMRALTEQLLAAKIATVKQVQALQAQEQKEREASMQNSDPGVISAPAPTMQKQSSTGGKEDNSGTKGLERSTRRALASVGSFFKGLKEKASSSSSSSSANTKTDADSVSNAGTHGLSPGAESSEELREKAYAAALSYQLAVSSSNQRQNQYYSSDLPTLFSEFQRLEITRLNCLKHFLGLLAANQSLVVSPNKQRIQSLIQSVAFMHSEKDCSEFASSVVAQVGEVVQPNSYVYDLQWKPEQIRQAKMEDAAATAAKETTPTASKEDSTSSNETSSSTTAPSNSAHVGRSSLSSGYPSFFSGLSLDAQMDLQESRGLGSGGVLGGELLDLPVVFHALMKGLREKQAFNKSNLFFLSCSKDGLEKLKSQFDAGEFSTRSHGVDILAGGLKSWFRSLPDPLVPVALYPAAISAVKKDHSAVQSERQAQHEALLAAQASASQPQNALDGSERTKSTHSATSSSSTSAPGGPSNTPTTPATPTSDDRPRSSSMSSTPFLASSPLPLLPSAQMQGYAMAIFAALPTLNQRVLTQLAMLLSDISSANAMVIGGNSGGLTSPTSTSKTEPSTAELDLQKWAQNMHACSAIFTAVVLRNTQADTTELLLNASKEARFAGSLFISIAQQQQQQQQQQAQSKKSPAALSQHSSSVLSTPAVTPFSPTPTTAVSTPSVNQQDVNTSATSEHQPAVEIAPGESPSEVAETPKFETGEPADE